MDKVSGRENLWLIVLAGDDGVRIMECIRRWLGYEKPKRYRTFLRSRSRFRHTVDRAVRMETPDVLGQPARIADTSDKIGKEPASAAEPLPFLYQG